MTYVIIHRELHRQHRLTIDASIVLGTASPPAQLITRSDPPYRTLQEDNNKILYYTTRTYSRNLYSMIIFPYTTFELIIMKD